MEPAVSDLFGFFGFGPALATNFLLVLLDELGNTVDAGTPYSLRYVNPNTGQQIVVPLLHKPGVPYQDNFPENTPITFALDVVNPGRYAPGQTGQTTIAPGASGVLRVLLTYPVGTVYARLIRKRFS